MSDEVKKLLRYNTGYDKRVFIKFKEKFDAVIFNATIVAHSGAAIADLVSVHKNQYIIDPQTHIFQHHISAIKSPKTNEIKSSIGKYLDRLPIELKEMIVKRQGLLIPEDIFPLIENLSDKTFEFETNYVNSFIKLKEYEKYLEYVNVGPKPNLLIAPYFMLKGEYDFDEISKWLEINRICLSDFIKNQNRTCDVAAQLVIDKKILLNSGLIESIKKTYALEGYEYIFVWIDNFSTFSALKDERVAFKKLMELFSSMNKKMIMTYGGYDAFLLCNKGVKNRIFGVAQSIGYGESRPITPVGGGFPVNKYYFLPVHKRLKFLEAASILEQNGYFDESLSNEERLLRYRKEICDCPQCKDVLLNDINNFILYNESTPFTIRMRSGAVKRNRPTSDADFISAMHFLYSKVTEWERVTKLPLPELIKDLQEKYLLFYNQEYGSIKEWCEIYAK